MATALLLIVAILFSKGQSEVGCSWEEVADSFEKAWTSCVIEPSSTAPLCDQADTFFESCLPDHVLRCLSGDREKAEFLAQVNEHTDEDIDAASNPFFACDSARRFFFGDRRS